MNVNFFQRAAFGVKQQKPFMNIPCEQSTEHGLTISK